MILSIIKAYAPETVSSRAPTCRNKCEAQGNSGYRSGIAEKSEITEKREKSYRLLNVQLENKRWSQVRILPCYCAFILVESPPERPRAGKDGLMDMNDDMIDADPQGIDIVRLRES